ncbi:MAG TPA: DUF4864 domain-containing protein [Stellaceae bacterium]|nr:DUF4864 domain-containing protein [Stellaceae bacterium]
MRRLLPSLLIVWLVAAAGSAPAQDKSAPLGAADKTAIHDVIAHQLAAFQKDDGATAFAYATPELRERFGTVGNFMDMVKHDYAPVYRPSEITFGKLEQGDDGIIQHVMLLGPDGNLHEALYFMERQTSGGWLIGGCLLLTTDLKSS